MYWSRCFEEYRYFEPVDQLLAPVIFEGAMHIRRSDDRVKLFVEGMLMGCCCPCQEVLEDKRLILDYSFPGGCPPKDPAQWEVVVNGVARVVVPSTTIYMPDLGVYSEELLCRAECAKVCVESGTLRVATRPMGTDAAEQYGTLFQSGACFTLVDSEVRQASLWSPDGAQVTISLYE